MYQQENVEARIKTNALSSLVGSCNTGIELTRFELHEQEVGVALALCLLLNCLCLQANLNSLATQLVDTTTSRREALFASIEVENSKRKRCQDEVKAILKKARARLSEKAESDSTTPNK